MAKNIEKVIIFFLIFFFYKKRKGIQKIVIDIKLKEYVPTADKICTVSIDQDQV